MKNLFCTHNQSLALKELGFDEPCFAAYSEDEDNSSLFIYWNDLVNMSELFISQDNCEKFDYECLAPTFSQVFEWFRKQGYDTKVQKESDGFYFGFYWTGAAWVIVGNGSYEEAESACIDKLIEMVKKK